MDEMFPISMPYYPGNPIKVYCEEFLTNRKNGDFDTVGVFYAVNPKDEMLGISWFIKESDKGWTEIDEDEYKEIRGIKIVE